MLIERDHCTVCSSPDVTIRYALRYQGSELSRYFANYYGLDRRGLEGDYAAALRDAEFVLQECARCHAITQRFAPDEAVANKLYGEWIDDDPGRVYKRHPKFLEYTHQLQEAMILTRFLLRHRAKSVPSDLKVLDFGLGWGRFAAAMQACGCQVYGFDLSHERTELARKKGIQILSYDQIPGQELDFINTEQVLEHVPEPLETGRHLSRGLTRGGVLKISVPFARWMENGGELKFDWSMGSSEKEPGAGKGSPMPVFPLEHLTYFKRPSLDVMAGLLGMRPVKFKVSDELNFAFDWQGPRGIAKNLARPFIRDRIRNYRLFALEGGATA